MRKNVNFFKKMTKFEFMIKINYNFAVKIQKSAKFIRICA